MLVPRWWIFFCLAACVPGPRSPAEGGTLSSNLPGLKLTAATAPASAAAPPSASSPAAPPVAASQPATAPAPVAERPAERVVIYGAAWCKACRAAKSYLERRRISYQWRDLDEELPAREELLSKMIEARYPYYDGMIPVISVDRVLLIGFNEGDLARLLHEAKIKAKSR